MSRRSQSKPLIRVLSHTGAKNLDCVRKCNMVREVNFSRSISLLNVYELDSHWFRIFNPQLGINVLMSIHLQLAK